jgi:hypothetical protein
MNNDGVKGAETLLVSALSAFMTFIRDENLHEDNSNAYYDPDQGGPLVDINSANTAGLSSWVHD